MSEDREKQEKFHMSNGRKLRLFFALSWKTVPSYLILLVLNTLLSGAQVLCNVILPKYLIDELTGGRDPQRLLWFAGLIVGSNLFFAWAVRYMKRKMDVQNQYTNQRMEALLGEKIMKLEYGVLENPYYLDLKERAVFAVNNMQVMMSLITETAELLKNGVTVAGLAAVMFTLSPALVVILLALVGGMLLLQRKYSVSQKKIFDEIIPVNRRYGYYINLSFDGNLQKDIRLYDMADMLSERIIVYNTMIKDTFDAFSKKKGLYMGLYGVINDLQTALAYTYVGLRVITDWFGGRIGLGSFTMYVSAAVQFSGCITKFGGSVIEVGRLLNYLDPFMELLSLPDEKENTEGLPFAGPVKQIEFRHVSFAYAGTSRRVLENVSFCVNQGEKISVVGLNGAGKTTLIKLLCRLYRPDEGEILVNGHDIFTYNYDSYMKELAAVFQDYRLFAFTIGENISCRAEGEDEERILELADQVGLTEKLADLPQGIHTLLGKAYDESGTELSGGQSQKVAIARALYKDASLIILDEPTSALDPLAEAEIYENFNELAGGRTALYISHRMSSSVFCDKVLVIDKGRVTDFAPHEELMKKTDSLYYKLFRTQAENYAG